MVPVCNLNVPTMRQGAERQENCLETPRPASQEHHQIEIRETLPQNQSEGLRGGSKDNMSSQKFSNPSSVPRSYMTEGEKEPPLSCPLTSTGTPQHECTHSHIYRPLTQRHTPYF